MVVSHQNANAAAHQAQPEADDALLRQAQDLAMRFTVIKRFITRIGFCLTIFSAVAVAFIAFDVSYLTASLLGHVFCIIPYITMPASEERKYMATLFNIIPLFAWMHTWVCECEQTPIYPVCGIHAIIFIVIFLVQMCYYLLRATIHCDVKVAFAITIIQTFAHYQWTSSHLNGDDVLDDLVAGMYPQFVFALLLNFALAIVFSRMMRRIGRLETTPHLWWHVLILATYSTCLLAVRYVHWQLFVGAVEMENVTVQQ